MRLSWAPRPRPGVHQEGARRERTDPPDHPWARWEPPPVTPFHAAEHGVRVGAAGWPER